MFRFRTPLRPISSLRRTPMTWIRAEPRNIELPKEINETSKQSSQARTKIPSRIEMSGVLTTGYWPPYPPTDVRLPHKCSLYQLCSGVDENAAGACAQLVFAPIDESFAGDAPLLPSGFRCLFRFIQMGSLSKRDIHAAVSGDPEPHHPPPRPVPRCIGVRFWKKNCGNGFNSIEDKELYYKVCPHRMWDAWNNWKDEHGY